MQYRDPEGPKQSGMKCSCKAALELIGANKAEVNN